MARGRPKGADGTRKAIVEAAMRGFAEKGFAATGTREIAAMAEHQRRLDRLPLRRQGGPAHSPAPSTSSS